MVICDGSIKIIPVSRFSPPAIHHSKMALSVRTVVYIERNIAMAQKTVSEKFRNAECEFAPKYRRCFTLKFPGIYTSDKIRKYFVLNFNNASFFNIGHCKLLNDQILISFFFKYAGLFQF